MKTKTKKAPVTKKPLPKTRTPAAKNKKAKIEVWQLRLYVTDRTHRSLTALANLRRICETHLKGRYRITVIDLLKQPQLARGHQILAVPTVVRKLPHPVRTIIGTLSDTEHVLTGLDLRPHD
jgi:circadian clock protein KaiB